MGSKTVKLGDSDRAALIPCVLQGGRQLWAAVKGVGALSSFYFDKLPDDRKAFSQSEPRKRIALPFDSEP